MDVPKELMLPCNITVPILVRTSIIAIENPVVKSSSNIVQLMVNLRIFICSNGQYFAIYINRKSAENPCAITVAKAAPLTPILSVFTKKISSITFKTDAIISAYSGI